MERSFCRYMLMRKLILFVSCSLLLMGQEKVAPATEQDWRFAHPEATLVGGIRPQALLQSPLLEEALKQNGQNPQNQAMFAMARSILSGITEVRFSIIDTGNQNMEAIALVQGHLDDAVVGMMAQGKASLRRLDANTLLMGDAAALDLAEKRMHQTEPMLRSRVLEGTDSLASHDFWLAGQIPAGQVPAGLNLNLRSIAVGLSIREGIQGELAMQTATAAMAEALIKEALKAESQQPTKFKGMFRTFVDGTTAHFTIDVPRDLALDVMRTGVTTQRSVAQSNAPQPLPPAAPAPPQRHTILIQGLDEGTREIPLQSQAR